MNLVELVKGLFGKKAQIMTSAGVVTVENETVLEVVPVEIEEEVSVKEVEAIKISKVSYRYERKDRRYHHVATIQIEGEVTDIKAVVGETAIVCGHHPAGYGCWNEQLEVADEENGVYQATWTSYDTCD